jgi:hypothetical protein
VREEKYMSPPTLEFITPCADATELEDTIVSIVQTYRGLKETDLWCLVMHRMTSVHKFPSPNLIADTIDRMIRRGALMGIDYAIGPDENTFILPNGATIIIQRTPPPSCS